MFLGTFVFLITKTVLKIKYFQLLRALIPRQTVREKLPATLQNFD